MNVRLERPVGIISGRPQDVRLRHPQDGQIGSLRDVLGRLEGDVLRTSWGPIFAGWEDVSIGGTGLTNINFATMSNQVKFIKTMKYFLTSLGQLAKTLDDVENKRVEKLTLQFLKQHSYFSQTWNMLDSSQKRAILDIIVSGKGIIPYKKINSIDSLNLKPENGIMFSKD